MNHVQWRPSWRQLLIGPAIALALLAMGLFATRTPAAPATGSADLKLTKSDSADPVAPGGSLTYTIEVSNAGPDLASNVVVTDQLPNQVTLVSAKASQGTCATKGRKVTCSLNDLGTGTGYETPATVTIEVKAPQKAGSISNTAKVSSDTGDPSAKNNSDTETTTVRGATQVTCKGAAATVVGTGAGEVLRGTEGNDVIQARGGDDTIRALGGRDRICAGGGDDGVRGGGENDTAIGGGGRDSISGQGGADLLKGSRGNDALKGGSGDDALRGGPGNDSCRGGAGDDSTKSC